MAAEDFKDVYRRDIVKQFRIYKMLGERAMAQVSDRDLHTRIDPESNSIAIIVKHLSGNLRSRFTDFLTTDGEKPTRNRDGEFEMPEEVSRIEMMHWWGTSWTITLETIDRLTSADLDRAVQIRGESMQVPEALNRLATHTAYHVGQIVFLAKHFTQARWSTLSIPKRRP
jgi:hypothetical protein